jgi:hypothetical protein
MEIHTENVFLEKNGKSESSEKQYEKNAKSMSIVQENIMQTLGSPIKIENEKITPEEAEKETNPMNTIARKKLNRSNGNIYEKEFFLNAKKALSFNFLEIIFGRICCNKKLTMKKQLFEKSREKLHYYMDVHTYIKKMQEIDILKFLLLNDDQRTLFNFIAKPSISLTNRNNDKFLHNEILQNQQIGYNLNKEEIKEIMKSYKHIYENIESGGNLSKKIVSLFNNEIAHLLD